MAKFLDTSGLTHAWSKLKTLLSNKADISDITEIQNKLNSINNSLIPTTWIQIPKINITDDSDNGVIDICYGEDKFVAIDDNGSGAYSYDGINWGICNEGGFCVSICYGKDKFVIGRTGDSVMISYA